MSQNDFTIINQGFPAFRADLNSALQALATNNSGDTEPTTMFANMWWYDSANNIMYIRNEDNDAWIKFAELDQANDKFVLSGTLQLDDGTVSAPALTFNSDTNMGIYRGGTDILKFVTAGTDAITIDASQGVTLAGKLDVSNGTIKLDGNYPTGTGNVALGDGALSSGSLSGGSNTAIGDDALRDNTTGVTNTGIGDTALRGNTTGIQNTGLGRGALQTNSTGNSNTAVGYNSLLSNTASNNTAVGYQSLTANTTGDRNVAIGLSSGSALTTGIRNTIIGTYAYNNATTQSYSTCIGHASGNGSSGTNNTFIGEASGSVMSTGSKNTIIGSYSGNQGGLDIRTSSNNIVLSDGDGNPRGYYLTQWFFETPTNDSYTAIFRNSTTGIYPYGPYIQYTNSAPDDNNGRFLTCGDTTTSRLFIYNDGDVVNHDNSYGAISDVKLKEQITDASSQWDDIKALTVRKYKMKSDVAEKGDSDEHWRLGVIAQEVEEAGMSGLIKNSPDKDADNNDLGTTTKEVKYSILYMKAVKALQEAMTRIETLEAKVTALENA